MSKEKFLLELREYLSILENQEQEDILAEYAQHIDMKMQKGLSEEEAIRDFGPMQELASEILEAYHVKPEFRRKSGVLKLPVVKTGKADDRKLFIKSGFDWIRKKTAAVIHGIGRGFRWTGDKFQAAGRWLAKPFTARRANPSQKLSVTDGMEHGYGDTKEKGFNMEETGKRKGWAGSFCRATGRGIAALCRWLGAFCIFWLKFMWNAGWLLFSIICAGMAMIVLAGVGAMPVFLIQGYPLIGVFMICLGGLLCFGALSWGAFSMLIRKKRDNGELEKTDEEVQYEQTA